MSGVQKKDSLCRGTTMVLRFLLSGFTFALLSTGCATTSFEVVMTRYREAPICCKSYSDFSYENLQPGDSKSFDLNDASPAYAFDTGKSYFKAFRLPLFSAPYRIIIRSYIIGNDLRSAYIFLPQSILLNDRNEVVRSTDFRFLKLEEAGFAETAKETWGIMRKLEGHIDVTAENQQERFLVIYTTEKLLKARVSTSRWVSIPIIFPGIVTAIPVGKEEVLVSASPVGRINVSVVELPK